jgi:uncharacterized membrane protein
MKLERKQRQLIVLIIGLVIIVFGLLQIIFKFNINRKIVDDVTTVLFIGAAALLFTGRKKKDAAEPEIKQIDEISQPEDNTNNEENKPE